MKQYLDLCRHVLHDGKTRPDRTGTGTLSTFGYQMRFDLSVGFPLLTTKKLNWNNIVHELLWFLRGDTNIQYLHDHNVHIWDKWADTEGNLGPIYGKQWRHWTSFWPMENGNLHAMGEIDQILEVINNIKTDPYSRRHIISAWNVDDLDKMALPPCHCLFQFYVTMDGKLSCQLYQRAADIFLGVPYNIASYALLTHIIACLTDLAPGEFIHTLGDAHIYLNHLPQIQEQIYRTPMALPTLELNPEIKQKKLEDITGEDIMLKNYRAHPHIKGEIAV